MEVLSRAARAPRVRNKEKKSIRDDGGSQGSDLWLRDKQLSGGGRGGRRRVSLVNFRGGVGGREIGDGGWDGGQVGLRGTEEGRKSDASDLSHGRQESDGSGPAKSAGVVVPLDSLMIW